MDFLIEMSMHNYLHEGVIHLKHFVRRNIALWMMCLIALITAPPIVAQISVWDGTSTPWTKGSGTGADPYLIESAAMLSYLADVTGGESFYEGVRFRLTTDVDLGAKEWPGIGNAWPADYTSHKSGFMGHFDGGGHSVKNLNTGALFSGIGPGGVLRNLILESGNGSGAYLVSMMRSSSSYGPPTVDNCINHVNRRYGKDDYGPIGGIVGTALTQNAGSIYVMNCHNTGNLTGLQAAGGIVGENAGVGTLYIVSCTNQGNMTVDEYNYWRRGGASGMLGAQMYDNDKLVIENCYNTGSMSSPTDDSRGGILAFRRGSNTTITNSYYSASCGAAGLGVSKSITDMKTASFVNQLNNPLTGDNKFIISSPTFNDGLPMPITTMKNIYLKDVSSAVVTPQLCDKRMIVEFGIPFFSTYQGVIRLERAEGETSETFTTLKANLELKDGEVKNGMSIFTYQDETIEYDKFYRYRITHVIGEQAGKSFVSAPVMLDRTLIIEAPTVEQTKDGFAKLTWPTLPSLCDNNHSIKIHREGGTTQFTPVDVPAGDKEYIDQTGTTCIPYKYWLVVTNAGKALTGEKRNFMLTAEAPTFQKINATKGVYSNKVELTWGLNKPTMVTEYEIQRRRMNSGEEWYTLKTVNESKANMSYTDADLQPGLLYEYQLIARNDDPLCAVTVIKNDFGFCQPYGTVSGRITFGTGTAVPDALVRISSAEESVKMGKSLLFDKSRSNIGILMNDRSGGVPNSNHTLQFYLKANSLPSHTLIISNTELQVSVDGNKLKVRELEADISSFLASKAFFQVTYTSDKDSAVIYLNGVKAAKGTGFPSNETNRYINIGGDLPTGTSFYLDELRLWKKSLTATQVTNTYDRYLTGSEEGLIGYYTFDEGVQGYVFDRSNVSDIFNENHGTTEQVTISDIFPESNQLSYKSLTDINGNYTITGVPYTGKGTNYAIIPTLGTHQFEPAQHTRFVAASSEVSNDVTFKDISSFPVTGKIIYANTTIPVQGVSFKVDGQTCSRDGQIIKSDANGQYQIDVPIGQHFIVAELDGHTFTYQGRYPSGIDTKHNFQMPTKNVDFFDETRVTVVGRVVGGEIEAGKPVGFKQSKANIGKATLVLEPTAGANIYNLNTGDQAFASNTLKEVANSTFDLPKDKDQITIQTDPVTGEFTALLPPISFRIKDLYTKKLDKTLLGSESLSPIDANPLVVYTDSLTIDGKQKKFDYHQKVIVKYTVKTPSIRIAEEGKTEGIFGDRTRKVTLPSGEKQTIDLYTVKDGKATYTVGAPVYEQGRQYSWKLNAFEQYENWDASKDDISGVVYDRVPMAGCTVKFDNQIGRSKVLIGDDKGNMFAPEDIEIKAQEGTIKLNDQGEGTYYFQAGFPNTANGFLLGMNITVDNNGRTQGWDQNGIFKAYVLGSLPKGNNVLTKGPDEVSTILRDPAGSNSYSFIEQGSSTTYYSSTEKKEESGSIAEVYMSFGPKLTTSLGLGAEVELEVKVIADMTNTQSTKSEHVSTTTTKNTTTINQLISTSGSPDFVGAMGDVYVGNSKNQIFGTSDIVEVEPDGSGWKISCKEKFTLGMQVATAFRYTQTHIKHVLIPDFEKQRDKLLVPVESDLYNLGYPNNTNEPIYITKLKPGNPGYGSNNTDKEVWGNKALTAEQMKDPKTERPSYIMILPDPTKKENQKIFLDDIVYNNSQISLWEQTIANNEKAKLNSFYGNKVKNYSFDAGATINYSKQTTYEKEVAKTVTFETGFSFNMKAGATVNEAGMYIGATAENTVSTQNGEGTGEESSTTYGFHLEDEDAGNSYSIDVFEPADNFGYVFRTLGGRSSCPYEGPELTEYYQPGSQLSAATMQIDKPQLKIPISTLESIPSGKEGTLNIVLNNISEVGEDMWYRLAVDDATNPDGLIISMDGATLTNEGRMLMVKYDTPLQKTLKVKQSKPGVLNYENVALLMMSDCQCDPTSYQEVIQDVKTFSVQFVPSCSDLKLTIPNLIVNTSTKGAKLPVIINDFDRTYTNFGGIRLQYKGISDNDWTTLREFVYNTTIIPLINGSSTQQDMTGNSDASINYEVDMSNTQNWSDGVYQFRAITLCEFGKGNLVNNETEPITVTKDMAAPTTMGRPSPANGILTPNDEVSILFNKNIIPGKITDSKIKVQGVLNGHTVKHNVGLSFDGKGVAYTEFPINTGGSFSIEGWIQHEPGQAGTVFQFGSGTNLTTLSFGADNKPVVTVGGKVITADRAMPETGWMYLALQYDATNNNISLKYRGEESGDTPLIVSHALDKDESKQPSTIGRFYIGNTAKEDAGFKGKIRQVTIWSDYRSESAIQTDFNLSKSGNERYLTGYWPLEEGTSKQAVDKARARHLTLKTPWFIDPEGKAVAFSGTDSYVALNATLLGLNANSNYSIEFWFKAEEGQTNATFFSSGDGLREEADMRLGTLSIGLDETGAVRLKTIGNSYKVSEATIRDNEWHHFALSVTRGSGNAVAYIDGTQTWQTPNVNVGSPTAEYIYLGACGYKVSKQAAFITDRFLKGAIDEVRIYNTALPKQNILLDMNAKLNGKEVGLIAYYPFEKYKIVEQQQTVVYTLDDMYTPESGVQNGGTATATAAIETGYAPPMKDVRPYENVAFNYTASDNKIVINVTEEMQRIENCTLEFSVDRVVDANGNIMKPVVWTAYVSLNRLKWVTEEVTLTQNKLESTSFKATVSNAGAAEESFILQDVPAWLKASTTQGTLKPQKTQDITFTVDPATNIGSYEATILLSGKDNVNEPFNVKLNVLGDKPNWTVNPNDFENSMSLIGQVTIEGLYQEDNQDMVAAFIGDTCVGVGSPKFMPAQNVYLLFLDIYGNKEHVSKEIVFRLWDAGTGRIYPNLDFKEDRTATTTLRFTSDIVKGSIAKPVILNAKDRIEQALNLKEGWNWVSVNVKGVDKEPTNLEQFIANTGAKGQLLKSQKEGYLTYGNQEWDGALNTIQPVQMYMLQMKKNHVLNFVGKPVNVAETPVTLNKGWNWIGYLPQFSTTVADALAGVTKVQEGDIIKGRKGFSSYDGNNWFGSLEYMLPGEGYMYYSSNDIAQTFTYPSKPKSSGSLRSASTNESEDPFWTANAYQFESSMSMTAIVKSNGEELASGRYELGVFKGDECRGNICLKYNPKENRYLAYLTVYGSKDEKLEFRLYDHFTGKVLKNAEPGTVTYQDDAIIGSLTEPYPVNFSGMATDMEDIDGNYSVYPTRPTSRIYFSYPIEGVEGLEVIHANGAIMLRTKEVTDNSLDVSKIPGGVYFLRIQYNGKIYQHTFIKQ